MLEDGFRCREPVEYLMGERKKMVVIAALAILPPALVYGYAYDAVGLSALCDMSRTNPMDVFSNNTCSIHVSSVLFQYIDVLLFTTSLLAATMLGVAAVHWAQRKFASGAILVAFMKAHLIAAHYLRRLKRYACKVDGCK